jgi:hypothetical protein
MAKLERLAQNFNDAFAGTPATESQIERLKKYFSATREDPMIELCEIVKIGAKTFAGFGFLAAEKLLKDSGF